MNSRKVKSGVYYIRCLSTEKYYIGSAFSVEGRIMDHDKHLNRGTHRNKELQDDFKKYGPLNFQFKILETFNSKDSTILEDRENHWINYYKSLWPNGYNKLKAGRTNDYSELSKALKGREFSEEHKENLRKASTGKVFTDDIKQKMKENHANVSGTNNPRNKLSIEQCKEILNLLKEKTEEKKMDKYKRIGNLYGINESVVRKINNGTHWSCKLIKEK